MASLGRARQRWERHGSAVRGASWQGRAGLGPVTAVACGLVPQASAAPEQHFWPGLAGRCLARSGEVRRVDPRLGWAGHRPVTAVGRGLRAPAFRCPWAASTRHGRERHGRARPGVPRAGGARHGVAWTGGWSSAGFDSPPPTLLGEAGRGLAWPGLACRGWVRQGFQEGRPADIAVRVRDAHTRVLKWQGVVRPGTARPGGSGRGKGSTGDWQTPRFESVAPTHGPARPGIAWSGRSGPPLARHVVAGHGWARQGRGQQPSGRNSEAVRTQR